MNKEDKRFKIIKILHTLNDLCSVKFSKIPKNVSILYRKLYKYIKPHINLLKISFKSNDDKFIKNEDENNSNIFSNENQHNPLTKNEVNLNFIDDYCEIDKEKNNDDELEKENIQTESKIESQPLIINISNKDTNKSVKTYDFVSNMKEFNNNYKQFKTSYNLDDTWRVIIITLKEWVYKFFTMILSISKSEETITRNVELFFFYGLIIIREICNYPPFDLLNYNIIEENLQEKDQLLLFKNMCFKAPLALYYLFDYLIITHNEIKPNYYPNLIYMSRNSDFSYKYLVILKKKFFDNYFSSNIMYDEITLLDNKKIVNSNQMTNKEIFVELNDLILESLRSNLKQDLSNSKKMNFIYSIFSKNKSSINKELDGTPITDFFTMLNYSDEYSICHVNNITCFSIIFKYLYNLYDLSKYNTTESENIFSNLSEVISYLLSYCMRIFDQAENYIESNKHKTVIEKIKEYNNSLIEATVLESLKIINLICLIDNSLVSTISIRINQAYERIALKQSGLVFLEVLQFFINNNSLMIIDLDNYINQFFKLKLRYNYKYEMLSFSTLEFLYTNKTILSEMTQIFTSHFPLLLKIFATFPKYIDSKFYVLIEYMTKPNTINEVFNYILDLPCVILIIENFEDYISNRINNKLDIEDLFHSDYSKIISYLLRDEAYGQENVNLVMNIESYCTKIKCLFDSLIFTTRVYSTTNIVPKLINKYLEVIIEREDCSAACDVITLIFDRFSVFNEGEDKYISKMRNLMLKKLEEIFRKWPNIIKELEEKIISEVKHNFSNLVKRELICLLCWALGEYLINDCSDEEYNEDGVKKTYECLEKLLLENIEIFYKGKNEIQEESYNNSVEEMLNWYVNYCVEKYTEREVLDERILTILILALCKLAVKFKSFVSRTVKCFVEIQKDLVNINLYNRITEVLTCLTHISICSEYLIQ